MIRFHCTFVKKYFTYADPNKIFTKYLQTHNKRSANYSCYFLIGLVHAALTALSPQVLISRSLNLGHDWSNNECLIVEMVNPPCEKACSTLVNVTRIIHC